MAQIDPDVQQLLDALASGGLARLATEVTVRITAAIDGDVEVAPGDGRFAPDRALDRESQLDLATKIVMARLQDELALMERLGALASGLGVESIVVAPGAEIGSDIGDRRAAVRSESGRDNWDDLLSPRRWKSLETMMHVWNSVVGDLRQSWVRG